MSYKKEKTDGYLTVIGANSDIARQFVSDFSCRYSRITLASRDTASLELFCREKNLSNCVIKRLDITQNSETESFFEEEKCPDTVIFCAGHIEYKDGPEDNSADNIEKTARINFEGAVRIIERYAEMMSEAGKGKIVILSSCAGDRGKYSNRIYSASKSALNVYAQGLMCKYGKMPCIHLVKLVRVRTKMLKKAGSGSVKFACDPSEVSEHIDKILRKDKSTVSYCSAYWRFICFAVRIIPDFIFKRLDL